jgi:hypothetical protein
VSLVHDAVGNSRHQVQIVCARPSTGKCIAELYARMATLLGKNALSARELAFGRAPDCCALPQPPDLRVSLIRIYKELL